MVNEKEIVITRPDFETATWYGSQWLKKAVDDFTRLGLHVTDLAGDLAVKSEVEKAIDTYNPVYFTGVGHGNADVFTGQNYNKIFVTCDCQKLAGRDSYLLSCMTAQRLGGDIINKGGLSYQGYWISYTFVVERVEDEDIDNYDKAFCDTVCFSQFLYGRTATVADAFYLRKELARLWVKFWEKVGGGSAVIKWITHDELAEGEDKDSKLYGDKTRRRTEETWHRPAVMLIRKPRVKVNTPVTVAIAVACPQKCDLSGKTVQLIDHEGNVVAEKTLKLFQNGLYWTDFFTITFSNYGRFAYKAKFIGDETHPTEESLPQVFLVQGECTVKGTVTDAETKEPIQGATVRGGGKSTTTDENGNYALKVLAPATYTFTAYKTGYWSQSKRLTVEPDKTYTLDFQLKKKKVYTLKVTSTPVTGLKIFVNWKGYTTPYEGQFYERDWVRLYFPSPQTKDSAVYTFVKWLEDGSTSQKKYVYMTKDMTWTGVFTGGPERKGQPSESPVVTVTIHPKPEAEPTELTLTLDKTEYTSGEKMTLTGTLTFKSDGAPLPNRTIEIYENNNKIGTAKTDETGKYKYVHTAPEVEEDTEYNYQAKFAGDT